jgi:hypothetical protein
VTSPRPIAVVDLDGVLADVRHRLRHLEKGHKDWEAFFAGIPGDPALPEGMAVLHRLLEDHEVVLLTGRPERTREATEAWLEAQRLPRLRLIMRRERDRRPARQVKRQLLRTLSTGRQVAMVVDDDPDVCDALEADGWPVLRADWMPRDDVLSQAQEGEGRT